MEQAGGDNENLGNTHTAVEAVSTKTNSLVQSLRHSLPTIGSRGRDSAASAAPPRLLNDKANWGNGGGNQGGSGGNGRDGGGTTEASAAAAIAAAAAELSAAALAAAGPTADANPAHSAVGTQAEEHLSCKYTKEELLARHWGMNLVQMKRVKALLRMGVCEEDLEIADRLLKMGR